LVEVFIIPPHLGVHYSLHESGESHFRHEKKPATVGEEPPVFLVMGEAGTPMGNNIIRESLRDLGHASGICTAIFSVDSLSQDFRKYNRSAEKCFLIDIELFPKGTREVEVGVWSLSQNVERSNMQNSKRMAFQDLG
jgi:hypothetical protein